MSVVKLLHRFRECCHALIVFLCSLMSAKRRQLELQIHNKSIPAVSIFLKTTPGAMSNGKVPEMFKLLSFAT